jgi:hypothetical protein
LTAPDIFRAAKDGAIVWRPIAEAIEELKRRRRENEKLH